MSLDGIQGRNKVIDEELHLQQTAEAVEDVYRPLLRYYFAVFAVYYWVMLPTHFAFFSGTERVVMALLAFAAAALGTYGAWSMRLRVSGVRMEALTAALNFLVIANITMALNIGFDSAKLVYFVIVAMAFSLMSASWRQSFSSLVMAGLSFASFAPQLGSDTGFTFAFLAIGAAIASLSIAFLLRRSIVSAADSRLRAEYKLEDARKLEGELRNQSLSDSLTGLPNRRAFFIALNEAIDMAVHPSAHSLHTRRLIRCDDEALWLLIVDLDGFKAVNDIHGHHTGDKLLKEVAKRLCVSAGADAHISRMGGDEFHILLQSYTDEQIVAAQCERIIAALAEPYYIDERLIRISGSIGCKRLNMAIAAEPQIVQADFALMAAKREGKNCFVVFTREHARLAEEQFTVENALRNGDLANELGLVFQPQFDLGSNALTGVEALARWSNPEIGEMEPERFISIAEGSGLITGLTLMIVRKVFSQLVHFPRDLKVSINLSSHDLISDPTIERIIELAKEMDVDPQRIEYEVTETAMMADFDKATANLMRLRDAGYTIALDDFGTGYSNFSYLRELPINKLKVDRSFLQNPGDPMAEKMLASLAGMARILGVHCLLEGVEDELGLLVAKRVGAQSVQGFLFGKPVKAEAVFELAAKNQAEREQKNFRKLSDAAA